MGLVYQNAFPTIAFTRSADGRGGCFFNPHDMPYIWPTNEIFAQKSRFMLIHHPNLWESAKMEVPKLTRWATLRPGYGIRYLSGKGASKAVVNLGFLLFTRAWFPQERLMSPRMIHFGHMELLWECRCATWSKCLGPKPLLTSVPEYNNPFLMAYKPLPDFM